MSNTTEHTPDELIQLLTVGAGWYGGQNVGAAVHLLTFTQIPHLTAFHKSGVDVKRVPLHSGETDIALVRSWSDLADLRGADRMAGADHKLLALAVSLATGQAVNLRNNVDGFGHAYGRRVIEAFAIATGMAEFYTVTPTAALEANLARHAEMFG